MKKVLTKALLLILALTMVFSMVAILASCEEKPGENNDDPKLETDVLNHLPNTTFGNAKFTVLCRDEGNEFMREDSKGDRVDYAIYMRNTTIEDKYKIEFGYENRLYHEIPAFVSTLLKSGDDKSIDVVNNHIVYSTHIAVANNAMNMQDIPYIDFTKDWWVDSTLEDLTLNDKTFIAIGDMHTSAIGAVWCMYYNKELCKRYNIGDANGSLYDLVMVEKAWTYNTMMNYVKDIYSDANNSESRDDGDLYGLVTPGGSAANAYLWAWDNPVFSRNETTGELEYTFYSNKLTNIVDRLQDHIYHRTNGTYMSEKANDLFVNNQAVFINSLFSAAAGDLRTMDSETWGIIPYPMYNDKQDDYYSMSDGGHNAICVPISADEAKIERVGIIVEALNALSHDGLVKEYYDVGLKSKYIGDPKEAEVIDMMMANRVFDFGYIYLQFSSPAFLIQTLVQYPTQELTSSYKDAIKSISKAIVDAYAAFGLSHPGIEE